MTYLDLGILFVLSAILWCLLAFGLAAWTHFAVWMIDRLLDEIARLGDRVRGR